MRIQLIPNLVKSENRICLTRIRWEHGIMGVAGDGYSAKLSISVCFVPQDMWIGLFWKGAKFPSATERFCAWFALIPCFPVRVKLIKSWGGIIP